MGARSIAGAGLRLALLGATAWTVGCRTECAADGKASRDQIEREQKAMLRGQGICRELLWPKLAVVDARIVLTASKENVLAQRADLPAASVTVFPPLYERLVGYRTHFKAVRADPFEPTLYVTLDPALEPVKAATLLTTAAQAGYPRSRVSVAGAADLDVDWWVPPSDDAERQALCIDPRGTAFTVRAPGDAKPSEAAGLEALPSAIATACAGRTPCADVIGVGEREGATVGDMAGVAAAALGALPFKDRRPRLLLVTRAPVEMSSPATARLAKRPCAH